MKESRSATCMKGSSSMDDPLDIRRIHTNELEFGKILQEPVLTGKTTSEGNVERKERKEGLIWNEFNFLLIRLIYLLDIDSD